jgi:nudix-type nucleoside diphosphatase (YffH/AdpP family)
MENTNVRDVRQEILSANWYTLKKVSYAYRKKNGDWEQQFREVYDRGNGATILLYSPVKKSVILTRQFRMPTFLNGNEDGLLIEACAGLLDAHSPEDCIRKETEEETGYRVTEVRKVFEAYMSPGSVTEILHFFVAEYNTDMKAGAGGGLEHEQENIEVLELPVKEVWQMLESGKIRDAKTIMLLQYARLHDLI